MTMARAELSENKDEQEIQVHNMQASLATIMSKLNAAQQDLKTRYFFTIMDIYINIIYDRVKIRQFRLLTWKSFIGQFVNSVGGDDMG